MVVEPSPGQILEAVLTVSLTEADRVWATCVHSEDPDEIHLLESGEVTDEHRLTLQGLLSLSEYTCSVYSTCPTADPGAVTFPTSTPSADAVRFDVTRDETLEMSGAYTLLNDNEPCSFWPNNHMLIVDPEGRYRWFYEIDEGVTSDIDFSYLGDGMVHMGGGWGIFDESTSHRGIFKTMTLSGEMLEERDLPAFGIGYNHDSEPLDSGEVLSLTTSVNSLDGFSWYGVAIELWDPASSSVSWSWDSQPSVDAGLLTPSYDGGWWANSVSFVEDDHGEAAYVSLYQGQEIWRIDRATGELTARMGPHADFTLLDEAGAELPDSEWFYGQHDPEYTEDGRMLLHDNGNDRPGGEYTRVAEFQIDLDAETVTKLWDWTEAGWYNPIVGDADRLPNGNVLITKGYTWCLQFSGDNSAIVEIDPETGGVPWRLDLRDDQRLTYRAERVDGCDMFNNTLYCPDLLDRIDGLRAGEILPGE